MADANAIPGLNVCITRPCEAVRPVTVFLRYGRMAVVYSNNRRVCCNTPCCIGNGNIVGAGIRTGRIRNVRTANSRRETIYTCPGIVVWKFASRYQGSDVDGAVAMNRAVAGCHNSYGSDEIGAFCSAAM